MLKSFRPLLSIGSRNRNGLLREFSSAKIPLRFTFDEPNKKFRAMNDENVEVGHIEYSSPEDGTKRVMNLIHTITEPGFQGKGIAGALVEHVLDWSKSNNFKIIPTCSYVAKFVSKSSEWNDIIEK